MESAVEPETKRMKYDVLTETEEEVTIAIPKPMAKKIYRIPANTGLYAKSVSGLAVIVALLFVPLITLPGLVILALFAEVYSQYTKSHSKKSILGISSGSRTRKRTALHVSDAEKRRIALRSIRQPPFIRRRNKT